MGLAELNRLILVVMPDPDGPASPETSPQIQYQYDKTSNLRFVIDALGNITGGNKGVRSEWHCRIMIAL